MLKEIGRIYEYHDWANHQVLDAAEALIPSELDADLGGSFSTLMKTLKHNLLVEALFIRRWQEQPPQPMPVLPVLLDVGGKRGGVGHAVAACL